MSELLVDKHGPWTYDDLLRLPETPWRYEIVDGGLEVTPLPGLRHEVVAARLAQLLNQAIGPGRLALGPVGLDMSPTFRVPDLVVIDAATAARDVALLQPCDVVVVVEIVSPGTLTTDRVTKPAQYAQAGIRAYWRVETAPISVTAYALDDGSDVYRQLGAWSEADTLRLDRPVRVEIPVASLAP